MFPEGSEQTVSTTQAEPPAPGPRRPKADLWFASPSEEYILRLDTVAPDTQAARDRAAAVTVCDHLARHEPETPRRAVVATASMILGHLGLLEPLFVAAHPDRAAA